MCFTLRSIPGSQMQKDLIRRGPLRGRVGLNARIYQGPDSLWALLRYARRAQVPPQRPLPADQFLCSKMMYKVLNSCTLGCRACATHGRVLGRIMQH